MEKVATNVVNLVLKPTMSLLLSGTTHEQRKRIKIFVKDEYCHMLQGASSRFDNQLIQPSNMFPQSFPEVASDLDTATSGVSVVPDGPSISQSAEITDLPGYLQRLEKEVLHSDLDEFRKASPIRSRSSKPVSSKNMAINTPLVQQAIPITKLDSAEMFVDISATDRLGKSAMEVSPSGPVHGPSQESSDLVFESSFPPDFDRGRFPAQRRRRGNKHYTPGRPSQDKPDEHVDLPVPASTDSRPPSAGSERPSTMAKQSGIQDHPEESGNTIKKRLAARLKSDPRVQHIVQAVADKRATESESQEFQDLVEELKGEQRLISIRPSSYSQRSSMNANDADEDRFLSKRSSLLERDPLSGSTSKTSPKKLQGKDQIRFLKARSKWPVDYDLIAKHQKEDINRQHTKSDLALDPWMSSDAKVNKSLDRRKGLLSPFLANSSVQPTVNPIIAQVPSSESDTKSTSRPERPSSITQPRMNAWASRHHPLTIAADPHLEELVVSLILEQSEDSHLLDREDGSLVNHADQEQLLWEDSLLKHVDARSDNGGHKGVRARTRTFIRLETKVVDPISKPERHISSLLRHRELGFSSRRGIANTNRQLHLRTAEMIEPWRYWKGASGDIVAAAWAPDSTTYAVGAASHTNPEDLQYNRPCNLLFGNLVNNSLIELPDHRVDRPKPGDIAGTYNARQAVYDTCDPMVYETVSSVSFSSMSNHMYTASHDGTLKIWKVSSKGCSCVQTLQHDAKVTSIETSANQPQLFATGSETIQNAIRVYYTDGSEREPPKYEGLFSSKAQAKPGRHIYPECLHWGPTASNSHLLLAGFRQNVGEDSAQEGELCLWDANASRFEKVIPSAQSVLAAAWHPFLPFFATGGSPGGTSLTDRWSTKTVVRTWDLRSPRHYSMEYECPAYDMQDVTFHPIDSNIVTAGCTDGTSFVWDYRWHTQPLHRLRHGNPLVDWDHSRGTREQVDTGVMMSVWGLEGSLFYTGSSDGMIKAWDVRRHPNDVLVRNVAQFGTGIQSGAFSPDGTNLLVGDADGGVHILSSAPCGPRPSEDGAADVSPELPIKLERAPDGSGAALKATDDDIGVEGREAADILIKSGQLEYDAAYGVGKGPQYRGPYASDAMRQTFPQIKGKNIQEAARKEHFIKTRKAKINSEYLSSRGALKEAASKIGEEHMWDVTRSPNVTLLPPGTSESRRRLAEKLIRGSELAFGERMDWRPRVNAYFDIVPPTLQEGDGEDHKILESEMVEENHWWPDLGKDEITKAVAGLKIVGSHC